MAMHKFGIDVATSEEGKIELLELLAEFTARILPQDKKVFCLLIIHGCDFYQYLLQALAKILENRTRSMALNKEELSIVERYMKRMEGDGC